MLEWVAAGATIISGVSSIIGGQKADKKAREAGRANARLIQMETNEQLRRTRREFDMMRGETRAIIGASGVRFSGTPAAYLADMKREQYRQLTYTEMAGKQRAKAARKQGSYIGQSARMQGLTAGFQAFGGAASYASNVIGGGSTT